MVRVIERVDVVGYGRPATSALSDAIDRAQEGRPLAPVTVIVASNLAGLAARHTLAGGSVGGRRGLVNVTFVTVLRLAQLLTLDTPRERPPLTNPVLGSAVRRALRADPRPFAGVAQHVATETAVAATYAELSRLSPAARAAVAAEPSGALAVSLFERVHDHLGSYDDEDAVARAAATDAVLRRNAASLGHVVWYLPDQLSPAQTGLVAAVLSQAPSTVVVGLTGAADADEGVRRLCAAVGVEVGPLALVEVPTAQHLVSVADPEQEVIEALRGAVSLIDRGVVPERIGIFYPTADPYVRLIEQRTTAADIPASGPSAERLVDSVGARVLLAAMSLPGQQWRRDRVMALFASAPLRPGGQPARPAAWERVSRQAGVLAGLGDWRRKLTGFAAHATEVARQGEQTRHRLAAEDARQADDLLGAVRTVAEAVHEVGRARTWATKSAAAVDLLGALLGTDRSHLDWPVVERDDLDRVVDALTRLAVLDALEPNPGNEVFRRALEAELDVARARRVAYGKGLLYAPLSTAPGQDLDAVFVVGMTEGQCPAPRRDDALVPDAARAAAAGELATAADELRAQHRAVLAALAAAPAGSRTMTVPRGDLRSGRHVLPSRWLLDSASALAGRRVYSTEFAALGSPVVDVVPSFAAGLLRGPWPSQEDDDLGSASRHVTAGGDVLHHPAAAGSAGAIAVQRHRRSGAFTAFNGNLSGQRVPSPADGQSVHAPTALEEWAQCGFRYFLHRLLGLAEVDEPERLITASPIDRGSALHEVLERFIGEASASGTLPLAHEPWSAEARQRLHDLADEVFAELEGSGRSGRTVLWAMAKESMHAVLDTFLSTDDQWRAAEGAVPTEVELGFGLAGSSDSPVEITLSDQRTLRFRGLIDRVDRTARGYALYDYKTGSGRKFERLDRDPLLGGTALQLGVYAEAVRRRFGDQPVDVRYWLLEPAQGEHLRGYPSDAPFRARFDEVLRAITDGIGDGVFASEPGQLNTWRMTHESCMYCPFDRLCPTSRGADAERLAGDPAVAVRRRLRPPEEVDQDG